MFLESNSDPSDCLHWLPVQGSLRRRSISEHQRPLPTSVEAQEERAGRSGEESGSGRSGDEEEGLQAPLLSSPRKATAAASQARGSSLSSAIVFGVINTVASLPALIAFAAIVFKVTIAVAFMHIIMRLFALAVRLQMLKIRRAVRRIQSTHRICSPCANCFSSAAPSTRPSSASCREYFQFSLRGLGTSLPCHH